MATTHDRPGPAAIARHRAACLNGCDDCDARAGDALGTILNPGTGVPEDVRRRAAALWLSYDPYDQDGGW